MGNNLLQSQITHTDQSFYVNPNNQSQLNIEDFKVATHQRSQSQNGSDNRLQRMKASMGISRFGSQSRGDFSNERHQKVKEVAFQRGVQCDDTDLFDQIDHRKCLRCGLNDTNGQCKFHPAYPKDKTGTGKLLYSTEWNICRELCTPLSPPCHATQAHFYGVSYIVGDCSVAGT